MTTTSPESLALLGRAAKFRAEGKSWADAATQLAISHDELRRLVADHTRDYDRLARRARNEVHRESMDEALSTLRRLMKSEEPAVGMMAATTFVRYTLARMRLRTDAAGEQLVRESRKITVQAENVRSDNTSELAKVPKQQGVDATKKAAQPQAQAAATPVPSSSTPATTPTAPPTQARPATPPAAASQPSAAETLRRKRLFAAAVLGGTAPPLVKGGPQTLEVDRLMTSCLADAK